MKVILTLGKAVRDPRSMILLPEEGREVNEHDLYWARRLRDGDVIEAPPSGPPPETRASRSKQEA